MIVPKRHLGCGVALLATFVVACARSTVPASPPPPRPSPAIELSDTAAATIRVTLLQLNDVYEIQAVANGERGGLARVATLRRQLAAGNPNTYAVLAGDFLSPSALGTAIVDGERLAGRQMVAVLNAAGIDYATFGNHEFDIGEAQLRARLAEMRFTMISSNVWGDPTPFTGAVPHAIIDVAGATGERLRIGLVAATLDENQQPFVRYRDPLAAIRERVELLRDSVDVFVALTHLRYVDDIALAEEIPELDLILGGHEHENLVLRRGADFTPIVKADANVTSVYVHDLVFDARTRHVEITSRFVPITSAIEDDRATAAVAARWVDKAFRGFAESGFDPRAVVGVVQHDLDGLEASVRNRPTRLTRLLTTAMKAQATDAELAMLNGGAIRIDDVLKAGPVTQYDVLRVLPFADELLTVAVRGDLLVRVLTQGHESRGSGGYLQTTDNVQFHGTAWRVDNAVIDVNRIYRVAVNDYVASGKSSNLPFFNVNDDDPRSRTLAQNGDLRHAVIEYLAQSAHTPR